jgi:hypothetical protein
VHILAAVAQHEREMIAERTRGALQVAKARGVTLGNPRLAEARDKANAASVAAADAFAANVRPIIEQIRTSGVQSRRGVARALTARGIKTARGGTLTPSAVDRRRLQSCAPAPALSPQAQGVACSGRDQLREGGRAGGGGEIYDPTSKLRAVLKSPSFP